jgi:lysine 6-dehydrogenase
MKILILGAGLVGGPMAMDLKKDNKYEVSVADINPDNLSKLEGTDINTICMDLSNEDNLRNLVNNYDKIISAVPGFMGYNTLKTIIESGKDVVDIAFFPEDPFTLHDLARKNKVTAIIDCGVAPGMSNVLTGYAHHLLDETTNAISYVGGLPEIRTWPYEYKAVFSPIDVIEEYTRPARYIANGKLVVKPALSEPELLDFPGVGTLEAFNSDGIRTLAETIDAPNIKEKTLRYPGHIEKMKTPRETGFFSQEEVEVNGIKIKPMDLTGKLLFSAWELKEGEVDLTVMKVIVEGRKNGKKTTYVWDLLDKLDKTTGIHSMARTTGYAATVALRMIIDGLYEEKGISPPEYIGKNPDCVEYMLKGLAERNVVYKETVIKE